MLVIADENDYFGEYFPYQTELPRPVAGTQGLMATAWHRAHESWGAVQLQRRFEDQAERWMTEYDFAALDRGTLSGRSRGAHRLGRSKHGHRLYAER